MDLSECPKISPSILSEHFLHVTYATGYNIFACDTPPPPPRQKRSGHIYIHVLSDKRNVRVEAEAVRVLPHYYCDDFAIYL